MTRQEVSVKRFSFSLLAAAAALAGLAACNDPSPQADSAKPAVTAPVASRGAESPTPSKSVEKSAAPQASSAQTQLAADMELSGKVKEALQDPGRGRVEVSASDGVVTLYGTVERPADKDRVALAAMEVEGVRSVVNNLVVMRDS
jgi:osmotically-inducible protein OsmY